MTLLNKIFNLISPENTAVFDAPLAPEVSFYVVGDVHGCISQLEQLLKKIDGDNGFELTANIVFVGDYIDRGEHSAQVLHRLKKLSEDSTYNVTCLSGNHEDMLLKFIDDPREHGARWVRYGGLQTLASFGIGGISESSNPEALKTTCDNLITAMGEDLITWVRNLPLTYRTGNVVVVHAAADPSLPIEAQEKSTLRWGHKNFKKTVRTDDIWIVHGHTIVSEPNAQAGRIAIDTGAYATGRLTAAHIGPDILRYLFV